MDVGERRREGGRRGALEVEEGAASQGTQPPERAGRGLRPGPFREPRGSAGTLTSAQCDSDRTSILQNFQTRDV